MSASKVWAFLVRGLRIDVSYKLTFVGRYVGQAVHLLFIYFLGKVVESGSPHLLGAYSNRYFEFLLIGSLFAQYLTTGLRILPIQVREEMVLGTLESTLVTPTETPLALLGPSIWAHVEGAFMLAISLLAGTWLMGADFGQANWLSVLVVTSLSLVCLSSWGILSVGFVVVFKRTDPVNWLVGATIAFFSGVYFPITVLPTWLQFFSYLFPLTYSLDILRAAILRGTTLADMGPSLWALVLLTVVFLPLSVYALRWSIQRARQTGSLAHY